MLISAPGRLTKMAPKPIGSKSVGSIFFLIARNMSIPPTTHIAICFKRSISFAIIDSVINSINPFPFPIGLANKKDFYCKKTAIKVSLFNTIAGICRIDADCHKNLQATPFYLLSLYKVFIVLSSKQG